MKPPLDLRKYATQTSFRLILGGIVLLLVVGGGLILYFYGTGAAIFGIVCLLAGLFPIVMIVLILWVIEWLAKRGQNQ